MLCVRFYKLVLLIVFPIFNTNRYFSKPDLYLRVSQNYPGLFSHRYRIFNSRKMFSENHRKIMRLILKKNTNRLWMITPIRRLSQQVDLLYSTCRKAVRIYWQAWSWRISAWIFSAWRCNSANKFELSRGILWRPYNQTNLPTWIT